MHLRDARGNSENIYIAGFYAVPRVVTSRVAVSK